MKYCINCGKAIAKRTNTVRFEEPRAGREAYAQTVMIAGERRDVGHYPAVAAKPEGHRDVDERGDVIHYTANLPKTKQEAQRYSNFPILSVRRDHTGAFVRSISVWDGENYVDPYFDTGRCAQEFAYWAARRGVRK